MSKTLKLFTLLLVTVLVLSACSTPEPTPEDIEPEVTEFIPTQAPTAFVPTVEPTITPRPMDGEVETPEPEATLIKIDPIDRPAIEFDFVAYTSNNLNLTFNVPSYWEVSGDVPDSSTIVFSEPLHDIRSGEAIPASVTIAVNSAATAQTTDDADYAIDQVMNDLRAQYPSLQTSSKDNNAMLDETGRYVTYWIEMPLYEGSEHTLKMRGRCLVVPKDKKLYMVRYICPAELNSQYVKVFYEIRGSIKEL